MPYRRLPNTDKARLRALGKPFHKFEKDGPQNIPFSEASLTALRSLFPKFKNTLLNLEAARKNQTEKNKIYVELLRKARMYVSHYIQVMNFAINRSELKSNIRSYYGTEAFENNLPPLSSENDVLTWGMNILEGDRKRIMSGGNPFYNPSIALVRVNYEKLSDAYHFQKTLQATTDRGSSQVAAMRTEADELIVQLWNEIEQAFSHLPDSAKREKAQQYGIVYVFRKSEREKIKANKSQSQLDF
ncbi:MAG: hypothetical protein PF541_04175 [Prolixibacteraceae bacterium]|jgi:hypothetical protein|nr:hypothetical protein [Prolixibacteraceae bacterium]